MSAQDQVSTWLERLAGRFATEDAVDIEPLFHADCLWRDLVAFTWTIKTTEGLEAIGAMMAETLPNIKPSNLKLDGDVTAAGDEAEAWFTFETKVGIGRGHVRLKGGKCYTLYTSLRSLKGHEEKTGETRPYGALNGAHKNRKNWGEERDRVAAGLGYTEQPDTLIIGGGQCGIALGARLKQLGVPTLIIDKHPKAGDSWRNRYASLCLHDPVWSNHMPSIPFPEHWPVFTPKDMMGDFLQAYVHLMGLNYWSETECVSAKYDDEAKVWTVVVRRGGEETTLQPKQFVLATGLSGFAYTPAFDGQDIFRGEQQHSSEHKSADGYAGKKCVVVGSNNSAHDIAAALWEEGAEVTMLQRSSTYVIRSETFMKIMMEPIYSEAATRAGITLDVADDMAQSMPYKMLTQVQKGVTDMVRAVDAEFYENLEAAGFSLDHGEDGTGMFLKFLRRGSGYYLDVGASDLVISGDIKVKQGQVKALSESSVIMEDGGAVAADLVVYATGFGSVSNWIEALIDKETADKVGDIWGLGSDTRRDPGPWQGELKNMFKPTAQEGFWVMAGSLGQARQYSLYLALQLKARYEVMDTPVYEG